jgi:hypothetical protein
MTDDDGSGGGDDVNYCMTNGCRRDADTYGRCVTCRRAMGEMEDYYVGVRGREEIEEKLEELKERDGSVVYEGSMASVTARCSDEIRALRWVLGERDEL